LAQVPDRAAEWNFRPQSASITSVKSRGWGNRDMIIAALGNGVSGEKKQGRADLPTLSPPAVTHA
jgi:hypothetical protein